MVSPVPVTEIGAPAASVNDLVKASHSVLSLVT